MVKIRKDEFLDMLEKHFLSPIVIEWEITSRGKKSKRKKRYVCEDVYNKYLKSLL
jgi:hypothetical protein